MRPRPIALGVSGDDIPAITRFENRVGLIGIWPPRGFCPGKGAVAVIFQQKDIITPGSIASTANLKFLKGYDGIWRLDFRFFLKSRLINFKVHV